MSKATKLRFALITEDVLDKLRPRSQSENTRSKNMDEIYAAIRTTVIEVVDQKFEQLNTTINQLVEDRIAKILDQQNAGKLVSDWKRDSKEKVDKAFKVAAQSVESASSLKKRSPKYHRLSKKSPSWQEEQLPSSPEDQLPKRTRTKAQKITVMPIHRNAHVRSNIRTPLNNPTSPPPPPTPLSMDRNDLDDDEDGEDFLDGQDPSILTIAAQYLKKLEDARNRKNQQHQHQHQQLP
ncbi:uncharacterized protein LOC128260697 [Drosophila gunungcola]|uniref:Uncharacterized protein n=1 Tax=Drosophila gunungcola TaxID=103775 RepID=A0A9P9YEQ8_9MUSC|nr:uncharacterized protein LOC128260697 [Drosophila gunungcola]KAI8035428.1 hypothetical protein M5D96_011771 [Drosophila gunungcola]